MVGKNTTLEPEVNVNRRSVLQTVSGVSAVGAFGLGAVENVTASTHCCPCLNREEGDYSERDPEETEVAQDDKQDNVNGNPYEYAMDNRHSAMLGSSDYIDGRWQHTFYVGSYFRSYRRPGGSNDSDDWELYREVLSHGMRLDNKREDTSSLYTTNNPYDVGAAPPPNESDSDLGQYGDEAFTAVQLILSRYNPKVAIGLTAAELAYQLLDNDESEQDSDPITYQWNYNEEKCEAENYCHFIVRPHDDHRIAEVTVDMYASSAFSSTGGDLYFDLYVDPYTSNDFDSGDYGDSSLSDMSEEERRQFMTESSKFQKIPYDEIEDDHEKEMADGEPIWRALDPQVVIESGTRSE